MKIVKGNYGEVRICDNMDQKYGLPSLKNKSFDIGFTDFPYNVNFKGKAFGGKEYEDNKENYKEFCETRFKELKRICKGLVIFCGNPNLWMWSDIEHPRDLIIHYKPNARSISSMAYLCVHDCIICYGKFNRKFSTSVIRKDIKIQDIKVHPCPNNSSLYELMLSQLKPESVLDPFIGSGTTASACEFLGIKYLGMELMEEYITDIEKRIKQGQFKRKLNSTKNLRSL